MARDFRAEAMQRKREYRDQDAFAARYNAPLRTYQYKTQPEGMTTEQWRHHCHLRWILHGLPNQDQRRRHLAKIEEAHGAAFRKQIEQDLMDLWTTTKAAA